MIAVLVCLVTIPTQDNDAAATDVLVHPGEKLLEALPAFEPGGRTTGEPFAVEVPLAVGDFHLLRIVLRVEKRILSPGAPVTLTVAGPDGFTRRKEYRYFNAVIDDTIRDPMSQPVPIQPPGTRVSVVPDTQSKTSASSVGGPVMGFERHEMGEPGVYDVAVDLAGFTTVHRRTRVVRHLGENFIQHQNRQFDGWLMANRAALENERFKGFGGVIQRAVFRQGHRSVEVDFMEVPGTRSRTARPQQLFERDEWRDAPNVEVKLRRQRIKLRRNGAAFEAAWPTSDHVIFVRGDRYGGPERKVIELYLGFNQAVW